MANHQESRFGDGRKSGPVSDIPVASHMLTLAEDTDARRKGFTVKQARERFARMLKVPTRTLLHIRAKRSKSVPHFLMTGIRDILIDVLQAEIRALENQIAIARQVGADCNDNAFGEAAASLDAARQILAAAAAAGGARNQQRPHV